MFCLFDITFNPCLTNALLGPINGTTSQIVPNALGTICDVVPLIGPNRAFVKHGLKVMSKRQNKGIDALFKISEIEDFPSVFHAGFILGPRINAGGRVGESDLGAKLLTTDDDAYA